MNHAISRLKTTAAALVLVCGTLVPAAVQAQTLTGAGSTFINPIMTKWTADYQKETGVSINYQPVGSGAGINNLVTKTVDFAGSDGPMTDEDIASAHATFLHFPVVIGAVPIAYNVTGVGPGLTFSGPVLADIYLGKIRYWDDPALKKLNPGTTLPHNSITVVHRSDGSGTTNIFTSYLSKVSHEWRDGPGVGKSVKWPEGLGAKGSAGVAGIIKNHPDSIGYVELTYAIQNNITYGPVTNAHGKAIYPTAETAADAADGQKLPSDLRVFFTDTSNPAGYPISGFSWLIVSQNSPKAAELKRFINWVLTTGQASTKDLNYAPVPPGVLKREMAMLDEIK